eukprot:761490-Pleurochrysis_carterae.AAC.1
MPHARPLLPYVLYKQLHRLAVVRVAAWSRRVDEGEAVREGYELRPPIECCLQPAVVGGLAGPRLERRPQRLHSLPLLRRRLPLQPL